MKIALLEDNAAIIEYMTIALELAEHEVYVYTESSSLLETLLSGSEILYPLPYDLILVDLLLPSPISGLDTVKHIQQVIPQSQLPIIIVSATGQEELASIRAMLPDVPVLRKPFKMRMLLALMESLKLP